MVDFKTRCFPCTLPPPHASRVGVALFKEKLKMTSRNAIAMYRETGGGSEF